LYSLEQGVGTAWLDVLPCKDQWELDDATVKSALRFMLGVSPGPPHQVFYKCSCGYKGSDSHHAMTCDKLAGSRTLRHNIIQSMVQNGPILHHRPADDRSSAAGHSSSMEPQERHLKNLRVGDLGYGQRGAVLVSTLDDLVNVDISRPPGAPRGARGHVAGLSCLSSLNSTSSLTPPLAGGRPTACRKRYRRTLISFLFAYGKGAGTWAEPSQDARLQEASGC
jgi:hypothetical protein